MHTIVIAEGGLVYSWGVNDEGALGRKADKNTPDAESTPGLVPLPSGVAPAVDVSTGDSHVAVATSDGAVVAWGTFRTSSGLWAFTPDEQIARSPVVVYTPVDSSGRATALASGTDHVIALTAGGDVYSWVAARKVASVVSPRRTRITSASATMRRSANCSRRPRCPTSPRGA